jgi:hypothetical protein
MAGGITPDATGGFTMIVEFYIDGSIYACRNMPSIPRKGDCLIFKGKRYLAVNVDWIFSPHSSLGIEPYVKIDMAE